MASAYAPGLSFGAFFRGLVSPASGLQNLAEGQVCHLFSPVPIVKPTQHVFCMACDGSKALLRPARFIMAL